MTVSDELSREEKDQLDRSTKKAKTRLGVEEVKGDHHMDHNEDADVTMSVRDEVRDQVKELFPTAMGMSMTRKCISYRDICVGVNGDLQSDMEDMFYNQEEESSSEEEELREEEKEDLLCPEVKLSKEECKKAYQQWKQTLIVKVLGRKMSIRHDLLECGSQVVE